ncbi:hypothetical protein FGO68_gene11111 [Halteria grandinella]|uniref:Uncharacterized protein n=1 Tax=Halteria grandinella TaxID=5974 RepID=A0A8J8SZA8_HALGN|nr:hypothetical protein FGO68_gene11111 [Halteria grandinella]
MNNLFMRVILVKVPNCTSCPSGIKVTFYCNDDTCPRHLTHHFYCPNCSYLHNHRHYWISSYTKYIQGSAEDGLSNLNYSLSEISRFIPLVKCLDDISNAIDIPVELNIAADFSELRDLGRYVQHMITGQGESIRDISLNELIKMRQIWENFRRHLTRHFIFMKWTLNLSKQTMLL